MGKITTNTPLRVRSVSIEGNTRTDSSVIEDEVRDVYNATTVEGVHQGLLKATQGLERLGIFKGVNIIMQEAPDEARGETDLLIKVVEKGVLSAYTGTSVTREDVGLDASFTIRNPTGHAEIIQGTFSRTRLGDRLARLSLAKPRLWGRNIGLMVELHENTTNLERTSSVSEVARAVVAHVTTFDLRHRLSYELGLRDLMPRRHMKVPYACDASLSIISEARPSLKSALRYRYLDDRRDHPIMPTTGSMFMSLFELAGLALGDTSYMKAEVKGSTHTDLGLGGLSAGLAAHVGIVQPTSFFWREDEAASEGGFAPEPSSYFSDRYFMGGPASLRGFRYSGIGPRASPREGGCIRGDSLGGDLRYSATTSLALPLGPPVVEGLGIRAHVFADIGNLQSWSAPIGNLISDARVAVGGGVQASLGKMARLEMNYSVPLRKSKDDIEQKFQFGIAAVLEA